MQINPRGDDACDCLGGQLLAHAIKEGRPEAPKAFVIADEEGREIDTIPLAAVLPESLKE